MAAESISSTHPDTSQPPLVNKVAKSGLITIDLEQYYNDEPLTGFDLKEFLYMELILREKEFRQALNEHDWSRYHGHIVSVYCSADAIVASWAYMLVAQHALQHASRVVYGSPESNTFEPFRAGLEAEDWERFTGKRVLLKGCADREIPPSVYMYATQKLIPVADRIMYGEACSFVPVWRK